MGDTINRRDVLRGGAVALAAMLMPSEAGAEAAPADALGTLRADYLRRVQALAERLKPRFLSGELHGNGEADWEPVEHDDLPISETACGRLETEVAREFIGVPTVRYNEFDADQRHRAAFVLLCSPSMAGAVSSGASPEAHAIDSAVWDVLRIARQRQWYTPDATELPSDEDLGVRP